MAKFFKVQNANRSLGGIVPEPYDTLGGCLMGLVKAESADEISAMSALAANPRNGVNEITEAEYEEKRKKKAPNLVALAPSNPSHRLEAVMKGKGAVVVEGPDKPEPPKPAVTEIASVEDALKLDSIETAPQGQTPKKRGK